MTDTRDSTTSATAPGREASTRDRATGPVRLAQRTLASFPVRVWRHFLDHSGFLLASGVSYGTMFATFATVYVAFAAAGIWLGGSAAAVDTLVAAINRYIPGLIADDGLFTTAQVAQVARDARGVLAVTGAVAIVVAIWTAIGFVSFARRAVRSIFVLPPDRRSFVVLKARDLVAAIGLAVALAVGFSVGSAGTWALGHVFAALGVDSHSTWYAIGIGVASQAVSFAVFALTLGALLRFLTGTALGWRAIRSGVLIGAAGLTMLQLATGYLIGAVPRNPLLATFAIFVGMLLWFQLTGVILLSAAAWIAVKARDGGMRLLPPTAAERRAAEHDALVRAA
ncbi:MAG: YihY/virulence factor BrkB family protein, partial [Microbacterium sp.]